MRTWKNGIVIYSAKTKGGIWEERVLEVLGMLSLLSLAGIQGEMSNEEVYR